MHKWHKVPFMNLLTYENRLHAASLCLRLGIGGIFIVFGLDQLANPHNWLMYAPGELAALIEKKRWFTLYDFLRYQAIFEILLGIQIVAGIFTRFSALTAAMVLASIIYFIGLD